MANRTYEVDVRVGDQVVTVQMRAPEDVDQARLRERAGIEARRKVQAESERKTEAEKGDLLPFRRQVSDFMERNVPALGRFGIEVGGPSAGTAAGAAVGSLAGPVGTLAGGVIGGLGSEFLMQESGVSPRSKLGLVASGAGPLMGPAFRGAKKVGAKVFQKLPGVSIAMDRITAEAAMKRAAGLYRKLMPQTPSSNLFAEVTKGGFTINPFDLKSTARALDDVINRISPEMAGAFPQAAAAKNLALKLKRLYEPKFTGGGDGFSFVKGIDLSEAQDSLALLGRLIRQTERAGGIKSGTSKHIFAAFSDDLDEVAGSASFVSAKDRMGVFKLRRARAAYNKEKASEELGGMIEGATKAIKGEGDAVQTNFTKLLDDFRAKTNPKHKRYDKLFARGVADQKEEILETLEALNRFTAKAGLGPGGLVIRTRGAKMGEKAASGIAGALSFGMLSGNPLVAGLGALYGAKAPEHIANALLTRTGRALLMKAVRAGRRTIDIPAAAVRGQAAAQGAVNIPLGLQGLGDAGRFNQRFVP